MRTARPFSVYFKTKGCARFGVVSFLEARVESPQGWSFPPWYIMALLEGR